MMLKKNETIKELVVFKLSDFTNWLEKNHITESKVAVIKYKKHTGKLSPNAMDLMHEAICFGWIDTTTKRLDNDRYQVIYCKRTKNSKWSENTISYAKQLIKDNRMRAQGLHFYTEGLKKPTHDFGIPKNPEMPVELKNELNKITNKKLNLKARFDKIAPSKKKMYYRMILKAKLPETKQKRINEIINQLI